MIDIVESNTTANSSCEYLRTFAQYSITKFLGDKHLYPVYIAERDDDKELYVIKTMDTNDDSFLNECNIFQLPEHKNIIKAKEILTNVLPEIQLNDNALKGIKECGYEKQQNAVVTEFAENGDMFNYLMQGPLSESITRYFFEQILDAVEYLHKNNFCHLDLKLDNILLDKDYTIKLNDFGFASKIEKGKLLFNKVGTPSYRPPEMWKLGTDFKGYDGAKADIFQLGVLLYIFITGMPPFSEAHYEDLWYRPAIAGRWEVFWNFKEKAMKSRTQGPKVFDYNFKTLIMQLLCPDECLRPTIEEIRESDWYRNTLPASYKEVFAEMSGRKARMD